MENTTINWFPIEDVDEKVAKVFVNGSEGWLKVGVVGGFDDGSPAKIGDLLEIG